MTDVIRSAEVADRAISVRLDAEAQDALASLTRDGISQSQAIRAALIATSREARRTRLEEDAKRLGADPRDRELVREIQEFFGELDLPEG